MAALATRRSARRWSRGEASGGVVAPASSSAKKRSAPRSMTAASTPSLEEKCQ